MGSTLGVKLSKVDVKSEYTKFIGGLDMETPSFSVSPGSLFACLNYEAGTNGGYRRIDGYERYSGQPSPSNATYYHCTVTLTEEVNVGDTITGVNTGATGVVVLAGSGYLDFTKLTDTFEVENITVSGTPVGSIDTVPGAEGQTTGLLQGTALAAAADNYRADISAPTGSGAIRGVQILKGVLYAFVDNAGGTAGLIYKSSVAGWVNVPLYHEISFDTGVAEISDGAAITQLVSGATATVQRVVLESGVWGSTAAGRLILSSIVGTFNDTNDIQVAAATKVTSTSAATAITILPGGRYEFEVYNFYATLDTRRIYGCDGVNRGFEFDGTTYVPLDTGMTTDTPEYVSAFKKQLIFSFKGSSQNSGIGYPYKWTAVSGAAEIALGDDITGYVQLPGQALGIFARNLSEQLIGSSVDDFVLDSISDEVGCIPRTVQRMGYAYCLDDRGIIRVYPTDVYGNFEQNTISRLVQPVIDAMRKVVVASAVYRNRNQYRLYGSDGTGLCMTVMTDNSLSFTRFEYPDTVSCVCSGEDSTGKHVVFFGSTDGMVYQADKGSSFDGEDIESYIMLPFNTSGSPTVLKSYRKVTMEMSADGYTVIKFTPDFSYSFSEISPHILNEISIQGAGGYWDVSNWGEFFYDAAAISIPSFRIAGTGTSINFVAYSKSAIDLGHKLDGAIIHYTDRRLYR